MEDKLDDLVLSLVSRSDKHAETGPDTSLSSRLHAIGRQRGSFRNFTEESLIAEISHLESDVSMILEEEPAVITAREMEVPDAAVPKSSATIHEVMLRQISVALNEAALALDFSSLLLSGPRPSAAQTISPALKDAVPVGSLQYDLMQDDRLNSPGTATAKLAFQGQSLDYAADSLNRVSTQARRDAKSEKVFWLEIQALVDAGWFIFRPPKAGSVGLAVRFGPGEKDYLSLTMRADGRIEDSALTKVESLLAFSIKRETNIFLRLNDAEFRSEQRNTPAITLIGKLERARNTLQARRTFNSLVREARELHDVQVTMEKYRISIPLTSREDLVIEMLQIPTAEGQPKNDEGLIEDLSAHDSRFYTLVSSLRKLVSRISSPIAPSTGPIKQFMLWYYHGCHLSLLQSPLSLLINGLAQYNWQSRTPLISSSTPISSCAELAESNLSIQFLSTGISVAVKTVSPRSTELSVVAMAMSPMTLATFTTSTTTYSAKRAMTFIHYTIFETIMTDLVAQNPNLLRSDDHEVRLPNDLRVKVVLSKDGVIQLKREDGKKKQVLTELFVEICTDTDWN